MRSATFQIFFGTFAHGVSAVRQAGARRSTRMIVRRLGVCVWGGGGHCNVLILPGPPPPPPQTKRKGKNVHYGWMSKRGAVNQTLKRRFFILRSPALLYFSSEAPAQASPSAAKSENQRGHRRGIGSGDARSGDPLNASNSPTTGGSIFSGGGSIIGLATSAALERAEKASMLGVSFVGIERHSYS